MPLIRYTYPRDVRQFGDQPVVVEDVEARVLCDDMRRAVRVSEDELADLKRSDLLDVAEKVGADVPKNASKAKVADAIGKAQDPE